MTETPRLLLNPACPASGDPRMHRLTGILAALAGAEWAILTMWQEGWNRECRYVSGLPAGQPRELVLVESPDFRATLQVDSSSPAGEEAVAQAAFLVEQEMSVRKLGRQVGLLQGALDNTSAAVLLFDREGNIVYANPPADTMLTHQTEEPPRPAGADATGTPLMGLLCRWVEEAVAAPPGSSARTEVVTLADGTIVACEVLRIVTGEDEETGVVVLLQRVTAAPDLRLDILVKKFGLSPRERDVLRLLASGLQRTEIADTMCLSPHTVRDHIKRLYQKTGTSSKGELLRLLSRGGSETPAGPAR